MSDYRKRPEDDWDDELDFLDWDTPLTPPNRPQRKEPNRYPDDRTRYEPDPYRDPYQEYPDPDQSASYPPAPSEALPDAGPYGQQAPPRSRRPASQRGRSSRSYPPPYDEQLEREGEFPADLEGAQLAPGARRRARPRPERSMPSVSVPRPEVNDGIMVGVMAISLLSLVLMMATVLAQSGDLPDSFPIHLNANGDPDRWGNSGVVWRVPFGILMTLLMSLVIAVFLWNRDRFAARLAIAGTVLVQVVAWVAIADLLF